MKKIIISSTLIVSVVLISVLLFSNKSSNTSKKDQPNIVQEEVINTGTGNEGKESKKYEPISFSIISDIHTDTVRLENAINDLYNINSGMDLMVLNGDLVDEGLPNHYSSVQNTLNSNKALLPEILIKTIGNHEFFDYSKSSVLTVEESNQHIARFLEFSGEEKVYNDRWIKGYHFISLGSEQTNTADVGNVTAFISQEQLNWLSNKLDEAYKPGRPIFVLLHQPINNTPPNQQRGWVSSNQNLEVFNILSKYPEVVLFSSHTHTYLVSNNMVYLKQPYTAVYTGATHGPLKANEQGVRGYSEESQGLYAQVVDNKLIIKARDFGKKTWVEGAEYIRELK